MDSSSSSSLGSGVGVERQSHNDEEAMQPVESSPRESLEDEGDSACGGSDEQEDSSSAIGSEESEAADPSWAPPPTDTPMGRCPLRVLDRQRLEENPNDHWLRSEKEEQ